MSTAPHKMVPMSGLEPESNGLKDRDSNIELHRHENGTPCGT